MLFISSGYIINFSQNGNLTIGGTGSCMRLQSAFQYIAAHGFDCTRFRVKITHNRAGLHDVYLDLSAT